MNSFAITFEAVITLFGIGLIGFWILAKKKVPESIVDVLSPLTLDIALPCLVFYNITTKFDASSYSGWWKLPLWWAGFTLLAAIVTALLSRTVRKEYRREFSLSLFYHNAAFLPVGIIAGIYGTDSPYLADLFLLTMFYPAFFFNTYFIFFTKRKYSKIKLNWKKIIHPVLIITLISIAFKQTDTAKYIPGFIMDISSALGKVTIPLVMLLIGGTIFIDYRQKGEIYKREIIQFILYKNIIMPMMVLGLLVFIRPAFNVALILILQAASPPISAAPIITEREGGNRNLVNQFLLGSFFTAIISIPLIMWVFYSLFEN